jgi:hypothetical protein
MSGKATYYGLGKTATNFYCPITKLKVTNGGFSKLSVNPTKRITNAVKHGHLVEATKVDYEKWTSKQEGLGSGKLEEDELDLSAMTNNKLVDYYKLNYKVSEDDVKVFSKLNKEEKVKFLQDDEDEDEDEDEGRS